MSLAKDLLKLARDLLQPAGRNETRGRPQQGRLRRSVEIPRLHGLCVTLNAN